jgi:hypothetical protein
MTVKVVAQFNPLLASVNIVDTAANPYTAFQQFNTLLTPGVGGYIVVYNESAVGITFTLPQGDIVYHPPRMRRAYRIEGPNVVVAYSIEKHAIPSTSSQFSGYAQLETSSVTPPFLATISAGWDVVTVESYELSDHIDLRDYYLGEGRDKLTQWKIKAVNNASNSTITLTNTGFTNIILIKRLLFVAVANSSPAAGQLQVGGIDTIDSGGILYFNYAAMSGNSSVCDYDFSSSPLYSLPGTNVTFTFPNATYFISFFCQYLLQ